jgi:hypothetical protein
VSAATFLSFEQSRGVKFTPAQRVFYGVAFDDVQPRSLRGQDRELAREMFGDVDTIPAAARTVTLQLKGARIGGTRFGAEFGLYKCLTHPDTSALAPGEPLFDIGVAPDLRLARQWLRFKTGAAHASPAIARRIVSETADSMTLKRDDGRLVVVECLPATRGGSAVRGRSIGHGQMTEAGFFRNADFVVNDSEIFRALTARIVRGGKLLIETTPYLEDGLVHQLFERNHGHPRTVLAARCPTLLMRPDARTAAIVEEERQRDPDNAAREFDAQFMSGGAALFLDGAAVEACIDATLINMMPPGGA